MRLRNNIFAEAFDYLKREKGIKTQKRLAELMGVSQDTITRILKDRCDVTEDIVTKLQTASGCIFNLQWLRGEDPYHMLASDMVDESNQQESSLMLDPSSMVNALIAAKDDAIAALKRELATKDELVQAKDEQIDTLQNLLAEKDEHNETLKHRCAELRRTIDANNFGLEHLPFPPGVADRQESKHLKK